MKHEKRDKEIRNLKKQGESLITIGKRFKITDSRVNQIVKEGTYSDEYMKEKREWRLKYHRLLRIEALRRYSNEIPRCNCCGEKNIIFLCIDHIDGGGNKHRKELSYSNLSHWLRKNNYPKGFQVLCYNCNNAKKLGGCPHIKK